MLSRPTAPRTVYLFFKLLRNQGIRTWSGRRGEVPQVFVSHAQAAKELLDAEQDEELRPFWDWHLSVAQAELRNQEEEAKEARGE